MLIARQDWQDSAKCRGLDPELFHPQGIGTVAEDQTARAKAVCAGCAVRLQCLELALVMGSAAEGVWGGADERERRRLHSGPSPRAALTAAMKETARQLADSGLNAAQVAARMDVSKRHAHRLMQPESVAS